MGFEDPKVGFEDPKVGFEDPNLEKRPIFSSSVSKSWDFLLLPTFSTHFLKIKHQDLEPENQDLDTEIFQYPKVRKSAKC